MRALFVLLVACGAPSVSEPTKAKTLFTLDLQPATESSCNIVPYIGNVAVGTDAAYAITHAHLPPCNNGGGDASSKIKSSVYEFSKTGGPAMRIGDAGETQEGGGPRPRIAAGNGDAVWIYEPMAGTINAGSKNGLISGSFSVPNANVPAGIVVDATKTYLAGWSGPTGPASPMAPRYPCCGNTGGNPPPIGYAFVQLTNTTGTSASTIGTTAPSWYAEQVNNPLVANADNLYWLQHDSGAGAAIIGRPKAPGGVNDPIGTIPNDIPGGIAADAEHVAWSATTDMRPFFRDNNFETKVLMTDKFACLDLQLDGDFVYFLVEDVVDIPDNDDNILRNIGVARVSITTREMESIELGIPGPEAAPRSLFLDGDGIILAAPYIVARIDKAALDGQTQIEK